MAGRNAAKRERLFDLFINQPGHVDLTEGKYFWCPLCREKFVREDCVGDPPKLTLAHIVPQSQGGTWKTLSCAGCNNGNGSDIETDLLAEQVISDALKGIGGTPVLLPGGIKAEFSLHPETKRPHFKILTPMENPAVPAFRDRLMNAKAGEEFNSQLRWFRNGWCKAAICQSAYLLMFRLFGYDFARCATYNPVLNQIRDPNEDHLDVLTAEVEAGVAAELLGEQQAGIFFVSKPDRAILAVMRYVSPGEVDKFQAVAMPGPGEPALTAFRFSGMVFTPVEDNVEVSGRWGNPFVEEWRHWQKLAESGE